VYSLSREAEGISGSDHESTIKCLFHITFASRIAGLYTNGYITTVVTRQLVVNPLLLFTTESEETACDLMSMGNKMWRDAVVLYT
jgi:hypothetical protein